MRRMLGELVGEMRTQCISLHWGKLLIDVTKVMVATIEHRLVTKNRSMYK